jgi:hypothetical protein
MKILTSALIALGVIIWFIVICWLGVSFVMWQWAGIPDITGPEIRFGLAEWAVLTWFVWYVRP